MTDQTQINVGIAGLGRTGWNNHANAFAHLPEQFRVVAVCDPDPERQAEAVERFDCLAYATYEELVADKAVELMVVATPSNLKIFCIGGGNEHISAKKPSNTMPSRRSRPCAPASTSSSKSRWRATWRARTR